MIQNPSPFVTLSGERLTQPLVYCLWQNGALVYVGYSKCLRERISMHRTDGRKFDSITYACYDDEWSAKAAEQMLIRLIQPPLNQALYKSKQHYGRIDL